MLQAWRRYIRNGGHIVQERIGLGNDWELNNGSEPLYKALMTSPLDGNIRLCLVVCSLDLKVRSGMACH